MAPVDPDSLGFLVTDVARLLRGAMDERIAAAGLGITAGEGRVLSHMARCGAVRQAVLAERIGIEPMTVSAYIDRLEAQGFAERRPDPSDRRAKTLHLTPRGEDLLARIAPLARDLRRQAVRGLSDAEAAALGAMLKTLRANLAEDRAERTGAAA